MKFSITIAFTLLYFTFGYGQTNLVPNSSFEIYTSCPWALGEIYKTPPWFQASNLAVSTDFFHFCSLSQADVPYNICGYQNAKSGLGYAGLITFGKTHPSFTFPRPYREYLEVKLIDSLRSGKQYCVEFYVSLSNDFNIILSSTEYSIRYIDFD